MRLFVYDFNNTTDTTVIALLRVETSNGCFDTLTVPVLIRPNPIVTISGAEEYCVGTETTDITFNLTVGDFPFTIEYEKNGVSNTLQVFTSTDTTITETLSDTTVYKLVSVSDANSCSNFALSDSIIVNVRPSPLATLTGNATICNGESTNLTVNFTVGDANFNYRIETTVVSSGAIDTLDFVANADQAILPFNPTETTVYRLISITDANGCFSVVSESATITVNPLPNGILTGTTAICNGASADLTLDFDNIGTPDFFVQIERMSASLTDTISLSNQTDLANVPVTPTETTTYRLILVRDANGCERVTNSSTVITVNENPIASFTFTDDVCFGSPTDFTSNSSNGSVAINSFAWDFAGLGTSTISSPDFIFPNFGTFPVRLTVGDGNMCTDDTLINVTVVPNAVANFSVSPACDSSEVLFTNLVDETALVGSGVSIISYQWDFQNDGTIDVTRTTKQNETFVYDFNNTTDTTVIALLRVETSNGCFDTLTVPVLIRPNPIVTISGAEEYCVGTETTDITFNLTVGDFPYTVEYEKNGVSNTLQVFNSADTTITESISDTTVYKLVSVSDANSCSNSALSDSIEIQVHELPKADLLGGTDLCAGDTAKVMIDFVEGNAPYNITIGNSLDGTLVNLPRVLSDTTIEFTVTNSITYRVTALSDANSCDAIDLGDTTRFNVNPLPEVSIAGADRFCVGTDSARVTFSLTTGDFPYTVQYKKNGVSNSIQIVNSTDTTFAESISSATVYKLVSATDANGCFNMLSDSIEVQIDELPTANLSGSTALCAGDTANIMIDFVAGSFPYSIEISDSLGGVVASLPAVFSDTTIQLTPTDTITYKITALSDANSCDAIDFGTSATFIVNPLPVATISSGGDFCFDDGQAEITFALTTGDSPFQRILFERNDVLDSIKNVASPHTLTEVIADTTVYKLVSVTDANGCINTFTDSVQVNVNKLPVANLSGGTDLCFGDTANVLIDFDEDMIYQPFNIVIKNSLDADDSLILMPVTKDTVVKFVPTNTVTYSISFLSDINGCLATDFGTSTTFNVRPLPVGTLAGGTTICSGASTDLTVDFTVGDAEFAYQIERVTGGVTDTLSFDTGTDGLIVSINPIQNANYRLISIIDANGCSNVVSEPVVVNVNQSPVASFEFNNACLGFPTNFESNSTEGAGTISSYSWDFDNDGMDDITTTFDTASFIFPNSGTFPVRLTIEDANMCSDDTLINVTIKPNADARFTAPNACEFDPITFTNNTVIPVGVTVTSYEWDFDGDGMVDSVETTLNNPSFTYDLGGISTEVSRTATLRIVTSNGCFDTVSQAILIRPRPQIEISANGPFCESGTANIVFKATQGTAEFEINYTKNGTPQKIEIPEGDTEVTLIDNLTETTVYQLVSVNDKSLCENNTLSGSATVTVFERPTVTLSGGKDVCFGDNAEITIAITGTTGSFTFDIRNDESGATQTFSFPTAGTYTRTLPTRNTIGTNTYSVQNFTDAGVSVSCPPTTNTTVFTTTPLPTVSISSTEVCEDFDLEFVVTGASGTGDYEFDYTIDGVLLSGNPFMPITGTRPIDVSSSNSITISESNLEAGNYTLTITSFEDENECNPSATLPSFLVKVNPKPEARFEFDSEVYCATDDIEFRNTSTTASGSISNSDLNWVFDGANDGSDLFNDDTGLPVEFDFGDMAGIYQVGLEVENSFGCFDTTFQTVTINPLPAGTIGNDTTICFSNDGFDKNATQAKLLFNFTQGISPFDVQVEYTDDLGNTSLLSFDDLSNIDSVEVTPDIDNFVGTPKVVNYRLISIVDNIACPVMVDQSISVTIKPIPSAILSVDRNMICLGESIELEISNFEGTPDYIFDIDTVGDGSFVTLPASDLDGSLDTTLVVFPRVNKTFGLIRISDGGAESCANELNQTIDVDVRDLPTATISGNNTICLREFTNLVFNVDPNPRGSGLIAGSEDYLLTYSDGIKDTTIVVGASLQAIVPVNPTTTTTYTLKSIVEGSGQTCANNGLVGSVTINVNPLPDGELVISKPSVCFGDVVDIVFSDLGGTSTKYTVEYVNELGNTITVPDVSDGQVLQQYTVNSNATFTLVSITGDNGCPFSPNSSITVSAIQFPQSPGTVFGCEGQELILDANAFIAGGVDRYDEVTYLWTPSGSTNSTITVTDSDPLNYELSGTIKLGENTCEYTPIDIKVEFRNTPEFTAQGLKIVCYPDPFAFDTDTVTIVDESEPFDVYQWISAVDNDTLFGKTVALPYSEFGTEPPKNKQFLNVDIVVINSETQCFVKGLVPIQLSCPPIFQAPNAFTPNDDGNNDIFRIAIGNVNSIDFRVFNRWGEVIYLETGKDENDGIPPLRDDEYEGWNGKYRGKGADMPSGVYPWKMIYFNEDSEQVEELSGSLLLIR